MAISRKYIITVDGYNCKLSSPLTFYRNDALHLIFSINEYGVTVKNGVTSKQTMTLRPLSAILMIETPENEDYIESTMVVDDEIHFHIDSKYTNFVGVSRMQIVLTDENCCQVTLPEFKFEVRNNIYDAQLYSQDIFLVDENDNNIVTDEAMLIDVGDGVGTTKKEIKDLPLIDMIDGTENIMLQNEGGLTQRIKSNTLIETTLSKISNSVYYITNKDEISTITNAKKGSLIYIPENNNDSEMLFIVHVVDENDDGTTTINDYTELKLGGGSGGNTIPSLTYVSSMPENQNIYVTMENDVILRFNFTSPTYGTGNYRIYRNGSLVSTVVGEKGNVIVNLGKLTANGSYEYTVTATDYLGIPAPESLTFIVVCGGLELESSFDLTIKDTIFEVDTEISVPYIVNCSDTSAKIKIYGTILNDNGEKIKEEIISINSNSESGYWNVGKIETRGKYTLTLQGYTGETIEEEGNGIFKSEQLSYVFNILATGEIAIISELDTTNINTETYLTIPFKITTKVANYVLMRGKLFKKNENGEYELYRETDVSGISTTVNIINYWSIGVVPEGTYKYELVGSTVDGGIVSLENAIGEFDVAVAVYNKIQPITSNLIAWFDANEKRNSDSDRNIWYNNTKLGDTYRINLYDLNYNTNGWKHVDESLDDTQQGEYMLKFTGDSYGELVRVLANGQTERYSPFSIFSNSGVAGCAIECVFRTRNVGELNAKVITCQEKNTNNTCGVSIGYDTMYFSSDTQTMDLNFSEDEWIHAVFVVDRNIRKLSDIGQDNIENLNQTATMRIYLNGVLCSANMLSVDNFVDSAGKSFPLMLNCCLNDGVATNFGECEIKMLRIYNSYLTSSDVLTNYISSFYDITEQQRMNDRNDINKSPIPSVRFKRKEGTSNTFAFMNSITDKPTSKKYCVNCIMEYDDGKGNITTWDNVDVYLQGTSSLQYPMKNYKIKCFEDDEHTVKNKIVIPPKEGIWKPENCYTLKCDKHNVSL